MLTYLWRFYFDSLFVIALTLFTIFNPHAGLDILAFLLIAFIILQKLFGEYFILILLAARPVLDCWRDFSLFRLRDFDFNINAVLSLFLLMWSVYFFARNRPLFQKIRARIPWLLFIAWSIFSAVYSYDVSSTIREAMKAINIFSLFGISYILVIKDRARYSVAIRRALIAAAALPIAVGLYQLITRTGMTIDGIANRIYGTFAHPNVLATFTLLLLMVLVDEYVVKKNRFLLERPALARSTVAALMITLAFTFTRIAWIGAALFFIILGLRYYRKAVVVFILGTISFYVLFFPFNRYLKNNYTVNLQSYSLIARLTSRNEDADSVRWRREVIEKTLPLFRQRFLLGYGYGTFAMVWEDNKDARNIWDNTSEAHNDYLKVAFESGIIGLALYLAIFLMLIYQQTRFAVHHRWINSVFLTSILIYLVLSVSDNMLHHTPVIWWFWAIWGAWSAENQAASQI